MKSFAYAAAAVAAASTASAEFFSLLSVRSASPIHLQPIHANGQAFWIGKNTSTYCPAQVGAQCAKNSNETVLGYGNGGLSMATEVPGGQQVFIDPKTGVVSFTQAHSANKPAGAITNGWNLTHGQSFDSLSWRNGILFCSQSKSANNGPWKMYAQVKGLKFGKNCLGAGLIASNTSEPGAWQYTK